MAGMKTVIKNALPDNIPHAVCPCNSVGGSGLSAITVRECYLVPSRARKEANIIPSSRNED